jgi:regulatory protein
MTHSAYVAAVKMLARRELSEAQVRQRLARLGYDSDAIADAVARLKEQHSIDDARVAAAIARSESGARRRGRLRVRQRLQAAGIADPVAERAVEEAYAEVDVDALLAAVLDRRMAGQPTIASERELGRLYRHLVGQGFERDHVMKALKARYRPNPEAC